jgi:hypothetical protein
LQISNDKMNQFTCMGIRLEIIFPIRKHIFQSISTMPLGMPELFVLEGSHFAELSVSHRFGCLVQVWSITSCNRNVRNKRFI